MTVDPKDGAAPLTPAEKAKAAKAAAAEAARIAAEAAAAAEEAEKEAAAAEAEASAGATPAAQVPSGAAAEIAAGYSSEGRALELGSVVIDGLETLTRSDFRVPRFATVDQHHRSALHGQVQSGGDADHAGTEDNHIAHEEPLETFTGVANSASRAPAIPPAHSLRPCTGTAPRS